MDTDQFEQQNQDLEEEDGPWNPWVVQANDLLEAACVLFQGFANGADHDEAFAAFAAPSEGTYAELSRQMLTFRAMATECLLNAMWLRAGRELIVEGETPKVPGIRGHRLDAIAAVLQGQGVFEFTETDMDLLSRLSTYDARERAHAQREANKGRPRLPIGSVSDASPRPWDWVNDSACYADLTSRMWNVICGLGGASTADSGNSVRSRP
jgi:hypothetical protein